MAFERVGVDRSAQWLAAGEVDWDAVYEDQLPRLFNYFRFRLGSDADAEDLTSRTFEKAWSARERYRHDLSALTTWLFSIARNVALDHVRARRAHLPIEAAVDVAAEGTAEQDAERGSDLARLAALLSQLSEREQELIALKYGAALSNRGIARLTGLSESNVGTLLHRTVRALRAQW